MSAFLLAGAVALLCLPKRDRPSPASADVVAEARPHSRAIEDVRLGQRVLGRNPNRDEVDEALPEPEPGLWRSVTLRMAKGDEGALDIGLLRPLSWIEASSAAPGRTVALDLAEMGAVGPAEALTIGPCPEIKPGEGSVVTGTFTHIARGPLVRLELVGVSEAIEGTANHPVWSEDRASFVAMSELRAGERVRTPAGPVAVKSMSRRAGGERVYNLEVHGEHVYEVSTAGVLVHNTCTLTAYSDDLGHHVFAKRAFVGLPGYAPSKALCIGRSELARLGLVHDLAGGMTQTQRKLFRELFQSGRPNTLAEHARIARESLVAGGLSKKEAAGVVRRAMDQLKSWGITSPTSIPWGF